MKRPVKSQVEIARRAGIRRMCGLLATSWLWWVLLAAGELFGQVSREYDIKAVFLLNFAEFVEWPAEAFPDAEAPLIIGLLGNDPFESILDNVVHDESIRGRKVVIRRYRRVDQIELCHVLFISNSESWHLSQVLGALKGRPILTVSEMDDFARRAGMIQFVNEKAKVRLRINLAAAREAHLNVSSKLLRVATVVTE